MNYQETIDYLFARLPVFQHIGARAFKPGLHTTRELCKSLGDPQDKYPTIHVAGTNGKGSTSHMLAAILQQSGYKVGLYTSPHLKDFRERIRVNGNDINEQFIIDFTASQQSNIDRLNPSFFEVTVAMAFAYFAEAHVDVAVIEVGMGGRLDSTNIITPAISVITNISLDHTQFLGETLPEIAGEKAGIIKDSVPVVVSELQETAIAEVMLEKAKSLNAPITFGSERFDIIKTGMSVGKMLVQVIDKLSKESIWENLALDLAGSYQLKNLGGVLAAVEVLNTQGWNISRPSIQSALASVVALTGLKGRWQQLGLKPLIYCDTAHNVAGLTIAMEQFNDLPNQVKRFVVGFVGDKDITGMLQLFPKEGIYYFCQPGNVRALNASDLRDKALSVGLAGQVFGNVNEALQAAISDSGPEDAIYVGGSTFVVADIDQL
ncbi:bifunctional folylpolyglutamate synthase/dihydrofolate synthase [Dyadobacter luticola]|uniref:Dihydrofolate synthase/folylpolyglutamate synthase n=1 Tax=Dyadobacter luticola TaxID=1979387 RepID=A0A5R9L3P0_9BACT|nr:folylpolyglutamate synthase/dihydrofolate synthase family protein [Dyadobacter luticola]TLV02969.1 bifunctional folylpolyglutamate synthase/dihydrofolate synthase [Dyadobacter luticola]